MLKRIFGFLEGFTGKVKDFIIRFLKPPAIHVFSFSTFLSERFRILYRTFSMVLVGILTLGSFLYGHNQGLNRGMQIVNKEKNPQVIYVYPSVAPIPSPVQTPTARQQNVPARRTVTWGGPQLWDAVNKRRVENGVNPLNQKPELCTIAAIRLSEIRELGKLDGHEGFSNMPERRPDLKWIFESYTLGEFLIVGYPTPEETVAAWENTLGHRTLLVGGEWSWGCVYSQDTFGVAITGY